MIVVKVELWPGGSSLRKKTLKELRIANISKLAEISDYKYVLNDGENDFLPEKVGYVERHNRADGVLALLGRVWKGLGL